MLSLMVGFMFFVDSVHKGQKCAVLKHKTA